MIRIWLVVWMALSNLFSSTGAGLDNSTTVPAFVNIGVLYSFNTSVGRIVKIAVEAAVEDVNSDPSILGKTKLKVSLQEDSKYRGFLSIAEGKSFVIFPLFLCVKNQNFFSYTNDFVFRLDELLQVCQIINSCFE